MGKLSEKLNVEKRQCQRYLKKLSENKIINFKKIGPTVFGRTYFFNVSMFMSINQDFLFNIY